MTQWIYCPECATRLVADETLPEAPLRCPSGHFTKYDNSVATTIGVIRRHGLYLLVKRARSPKRGMWDAVGGFLQGTETAEECLIREAREETGLAVRPVRLLGAFSSVYGETGLKTLGIAYECTGDA